MKLPSVCSKVRELAVRRSARSSPGGVPGGWSVDGVVVGVGVAVGAGTAVGDGTTPRLGRGVALGPWLTGLGGCGAGVALGDAGAVDGAGSSPKTKAGAVAPAPYRSATTIRATTARPADPRI